MEDMNNQEIFDGNDKLSRDELSTLERFAGNQLDAKTVEELEANRDAMDKEIKAFLARDNISENSRKHVQALYAKIQNRTGGTEVIDGEDPSFMDGMEKAGEGIAEGFSSLWNSISSSVDDNREGLIKEGWKFSTLEVAGEDLEVRTKKEKDGSVAIYIDDNGVNTDIIGVPANMVKEALSFYKKTSENDMEMNDISIDTIGKVFDNIGDFVAGDTLDYNDKNSAFRLYMDSKSKGKNKS